MFREVETQIPLVTVPCPIPIIDVPPHCLSLGIKDSLKEKLLDVGGFWMKEGFLMGGVV
jgi:hypothetical protein